MDGPNPTGCRTKAKARGTGGQEDGSYTAAARQDIHCGCRIGTGGGSAEAGQKSKWHVRDYARLTQAGRVAKKVRGGPEATAGRRVRVQRVDRYTGRVARLGGGEV